MLWYLYLLSSLLMKFPANQRPLQKNIASIVTKAGEGASGRGGWVPGIQQLPYQFPVTPGGSSTQSVSISHASGFQGFIQNVCQFSLVIFVTLHV